jgi:branched-chain amino acid transport system substrate-binding protein
MADGGVLMRFIWIAVSLIMLAMLASCGGATGTTEKKGSGPAPAGGEALIGANLELSGESAPWGEDSRNGIILATEEINARPEQKIKLKFVFEDNKSEPAGSKNAMKKLVTQDNVLAVIGAVGSNRTIAASDVAMEEKVPLMTHASTNVTITKKGEYVSRICFHDDFQGSVMAKFARNSLKAQTAVIMVSKGNAYSEGLSASFRKTFTDGGGKILEELAYQKGTQDFKTHVTTLKNLNPNVVWLPGYFNEAGLIVKQAREAGFQVPFLGGDGWDDKELFRLAGPAIKGNFVCNHFDPGDPDPTVQQFVEKYSNRFKKKDGEKNIPGAMAALGYDAAYAMADAVSRAKELKPPAVKDAINTIKGVKGVCGVINMGPDREVIKSAVVLETSETEFKYKETIKP